MTTVDNTDAQVLAGILAATDDDNMPRVVATATVNGIQVDVVEPVMPASDDQPARRGYLYQAVIGDYVLSPARFGGLDSTRPVPGTAVLLPGGRLLTCSATANGALANARRQLRNRHNQYTPKG